MNKGKTTNQSFVNFYIKLINNGMHDPVFNGLAECISSAAPSLNDFDRFRLDDINLTKHDTRLEIMDLVETECAENIWFYFSEFIKIPNKSFMNLTPYIRFCLNDLIFSMICLYKKNRSFIIMPSNKAAYKYPKGATTAFMLLFLYNIKFLNNYNVKMLYDSISRDNINKPCYKLDGFSIGNHGKTRDNTSIIDLMNSNWMNQFATTDLNLTNTTHIFESINNFINKDYGLRCMGNINDSLRVKQIHFYNFITRIPDIPFLLMLNNVYLNNPFNDTYIACLESNLVDFLESQNTDYKSCLKFVFSTNFLHYTDTDFSNSILANKNFIDDLPKEKTIILTY